MSKYGRTPEGWARELERSRERHARRARERNPSLPPYLPRGPASAPTRPHVPDGHEVHGVSTLTGADGSERGQWTKTRPAGAELELPPGFRAVPISAYVGPDGLMRGQHVRIERDPAYVPEALDVPRVEPLPAPTHADEDTITLYPLGDPHIGMLAWAPETGENFDLSIATRDLRMAAQLLVAGAPPSARALVVNMGDYFHGRDNRWLTQSGHRLDADGRWEKVAQAGERLFRDIVDLALHRHQHVTVVTLQGNHDGEVAGRLVSHMRAAYEKEPRVTVEPCSRTYQYHRFGANLFGFTHGDRQGKFENLESIMAADRPQDFGETLFRLWLCGHVHHITRRELRTCVVETLRTLAAKDEWHASSGYRSRRSLDAITCHREFGEIFRRTVPIEMVKRALTREA